MTGHADESQAHDPWARIGKALANGNRTRREDVAALHAEVARLRLLTNPELTFRDLEAKIRDGSIDVHMTLGDECLPVTKFLAAMMWNFLLGEEGEGEEPPNYQSVEVTHTHHGERIRCYMEVVKPGGKSSREIRADLEAEIATLRKGDAA